MIDYIERILSTFEEIKKRFPNCKVKITESGHAEYEIYSSAYELEKILIADAKRESKS